MNNLMTYDQVISYLNKENRKHHLLLGNGFSVSYDKKIFSYNALHNGIMSDDDEIVKEVFKILNTQNFELVMAQLDNFRSIAQIFKTPSDIIAEVDVAIERLREKLLTIITSLHPEQVFSIPEKNSTSCANFLSEYLANGGHIFSTNYDILLYWVLMRNSIDNCIDGFGRYADNINGDEYMEEDEIEYSDLTWGKYKSEQNIHYLHGALPLFDVGADIIKAENNSTEWLLDAIKHKIYDKKYPIFVAAGNSSQKLDHIAHNKYLSFCYDKLTEITGSLVIFGFSFGENDKHIIQAINKAAKFGKKQFPKLNSVYIGVFSEDDYKHMKSIESQFKCKVNLYNARTANIWNNV